MVPVTPKFGDTKEALQEYIQKNAKYPTTLKKTPDSKPVFVRVVIEKDGRLVFHKVMRGTNAVLDAEAQRVVESMPAWKAGEAANGKTVRTYVDFPIWFE